MSGHCGEDCGCKDCEINFASDDESILVSVKPRCFGIPSASEKKAKMEIKNKNTYPIYFKAITSNMDVFGAIPNYGQIPPNSKLTVDVQFYDSAMPLRRHEEILVFTSMKPFEQHATYEKRVCSFCGKSSDFSKDHTRERHHTDGSSTVANHRRYKKNGKTSTYQTKNYSESSDDDDSKVPHHKHKTDYDPKQTKPKSMISPEETEKRKMKVDAKATKQHPVDYEHKRYLPSGQKELHSKVDRNRDCSLRRTKRTIGSHELQEVCIHARVHPPSDCGFPCRNCVVLSTDKYYKKVPEAYLASAKQYGARRVTSDEHTTEHRSYKTEKDAYAPHRMDDLRDDRRRKEGKSHTLARIIVAESDTDKSSDTESSELGCRHALNRLKIISEEGYQKKIKKTKLLKGYGEESEGATAKDIKDKQKESDEKITEIKRITTLEVLDEKCNILINLNWINLLFMFLLITIAAGSLICCYRSRRSEEETHSYFSRLWKLVGWSLYYFFV